jgi:hypothetical protein
MAISPSGVGACVFIFDKWNTGELTPEQIAQLKSLGIDSDAIDES